MAEQLGTTVNGTNSAEDITRVLNGMGGNPWQPVGDGTYWLSVSDLANWAGSRGYSA